VIGSRDGAVGIMTGYGLDDRGVGVRAPVRGIFSLFRVVYFGSEAQSAFYSVDKGALSPWVKRPRREAGHSLLTSGEVKKAGVIPRFLHAFSWRVLS
jgi:hypothetical protein